MVADPLDDGVGPRVADREPFPGQAPEESPARRRAIQHGVADDDRLVRQEQRPFWRTNDEPASGKTLAHVVVRLAFELEGQPVRRKGAEALPRRADEPQDDALVRQPNVAVTPGNLSRKHRPDGPISGFDGQTG